MLLYYETFKSTVTFILSYKKAICNKSSTDNKRKWRKLEYQPCQTCWVELNHIFDMMPLKCTLFCVSMQLCTIVETFQAKI